MLFIIVCPTVIAGPVRHPPPKPPSSLLPSCSPRVHVAVSPVVKAATRPVTGSCCPALTLCLPAQNRGVSSRPWESPMPLARLRRQERQTPRSCRRGQSWSILGTPRTKGCLCRSWWAWLLQETRASINLLQENNLHLFLFFFLMLVALFFHVS